MLDYTLGNNTSKTDVAPWCYNWVDWMDWIGWKSPGGRRYIAPHGANKGRVLKLRENITLDIPDMNLTFVTMLS